MMFIRSCTLTLKRNAEPKLSFDFIEYEKKLGVTLSLLPFYGSWAQTTNVASVIVL